MIHLNRKQLRISGNVSTGNADAVADEGSPPEEKLDALALQSCLIVGWQNMLLHQKLDYTFSRKYSSSSSFRVDKLKNNSNSFEQLSSWEVFVNLK